MLYVVLVLVGLLAGNRRLLLGGAVLGTLLIVAGFLLSPSGVEIWKVLVNRLLSIFTLWMNLHPLDDLFSLPTSKPFPG
jgi:hypothetical protein